VNESHIASHRLASLLPGNSYKHLDDARVGKGHVTTSTVTQQLKSFSRMLDQGFIGVRSRRDQFSSQEFSRVLDTRQPLKFRSEDEELTCDQKRRFMCNS
jgi:hypothetical protein